jgi:hypothetical protein
MTTVLGKPVVWQLLNIVIASLLGVGLGALARRRVIVMWPLPLAVGLLEWGLVFAAQNAVKAPDAHALWSELTNLAMVPAVMVASATGLGLAALMLGFQDTMKVSIRRLPGDDGNDLGPNWRTRNWMWDSEAVVDETPARPPPATSPLSPVPSHLPARPLPAARRDPQAPQHVFGGAAEPTASPPPSRPEPAKNLRTRPRRRSVLAGALVSRDLSAIPCTIRDLSVGGARVSPGGILAVGSPIVLVDRSNGIGHLASVVWRTDEDLGLRFSASINLAAPAVSEAAAIRDLWRRVP